MDGRNHGDRVEEWKGESEGEIRGGKGRDIESDKWKKKERGRNVCQ